MDGWQILSDKDAIVRVKEAVDAYAESDAPTAFLDRVIGPYTVSSTVSWKTRAASVGVALDRMQQAGQDVSTDVAPVMRLYMPESPTDLHKAEVLFSYLSRVVGRPVAPDSPLPVAAMVTAVGATGRFFSSFLFRADRLSGVHEHVLRGVVDAHMATMPTNTGPFLYYVASVLPAVYAGSWIHPYMRQTYFPDALTGVQADQLLCAIGGMDVPVEYRWMIVQLYAEEIVRIEPDSGYSHPMLRLFGTTTMSPVTFCQLLNTCMPVMKIRMTAPADASLPATELRRDLVVRILAYIFGMDESDALLKFTKEFLEGVLPGPLDWVRCLYAMYPTESVAAKLKDPGAPSFQIPSPLRDTDGPADCFDVVCSWYPELCAGPDDRPR